MLWHKPHVIGHHARVSVSTLKCVQLGAFLLPRRLLAGVLLGQLGLLPPQTGQFLLLGLLRVPLPLPPPLYCSASRSMCTQLCSVYGLIPRSRATWATGLPVSLTMCNAPARNSGAKRRRVTAATTKPFPVRSPRYGDAQVPFPRNRGGRPVAAGECRPGLRAAEST